MSKSSYLLLSVCALGLTGRLSSAAEKPAEQAAPAAVTSVKAVAPPRPASAPVKEDSTPEAKKPGMMGRMFGKKSATPVPATPAPKAGPALKTGDGKPAPEKAAPEKDTTSAKPKASAKPAPAPAVVKKAATPAAENEDPEVAEKRKYTEAKAKAVEDPALKELKTKADGAVSDEESRKDLRAYNKALFAKIRKLDPSLKDHADRMEAAILKQLSE